MNIYVGNLSYSTTETSLRQAFETHGRVESVSIIQDRATGRSRGFGFVVMPDGAQGAAAITGMNDKDLDGRRIKCNEAKPRSDSPGGGDDRRGGGNGGGQNRW